MAKAKKKAKKANAVLDRFIRPTPEREAHNDTRSAGAAVRIVPVIVRLHEQGVLSDHEFAALAYYRDQASLADRSPVRDSCDFSPRGSNGFGPGVAITSAKIETAHIEGNLGALWPLVRAVCVDDVTLERWCIERHGAINGSAIRANPQHVAIATLELKYAAGGIVRR